MAKQKKKRNKTYAGPDAAVTRPTITKISAANRSKIGQWWFEHKTVYKPFIIIAAITLFLIFMIIEIIRIINGG